MGKITDFQLFVSMGSDLHLLPLRPREEVYCHVAEDEITWHFPVRVMRDLANAKVEHGSDYIIPAVMSVESGLVAHMRENNGIEPERIARLADPFLSLPIIAIQNDPRRPDRTSIIDGHHRYVKFHEMKRQQIICFMFKFPFWQQFALPFDRSLHDTPGPSGMIEQDAKGGTL